MVEAQLIDQNRQQPNKMSIDQADLKGDTQRTSVKWAAFDNPISIDTMKQNSSVPQNMSLIGRAKNRKLQIKNLFNNVQAPNHRYMGPSTTKSKGGPKIAGLNVIPLQSTSGTKGSISAIKFQGIFKKQAQ